MLPNLTYCVVLNKGSLKRKSDEVDLSNVSRPSEKASAFNFASSTPTVVTVNKKPMFTNCKYLLFCEDYLSLFLKPFILGKMILILKKYLKKKIII